MFMQYETLQNLANIAISLGILLSAIGGYGSYYYGKIIEKEKGEVAKITEVKLNNEIERLSTSAEKLEKRLIPFEKTAQTLYPNLQLEAALDKLINDTIELRKRTDQIESKQKPRTISVERKIEFIDSLRDAPKGTVEIYSFGNADPETISFANILRDMVTSAGYDTGKMVGLLFGGQTIPKGFAMFIKDEQNQPAHGGPIQKAFWKIGFQLEAGIDQSINTDEVRIIVGVKP